MAQPVAARPSAPAGPPRDLPALLRRILTLATPTTVLAIFQVIAQLAETWLAARQGTAALAGWAVVLPFALLLQQMSAGAMGGGVVSAIARALGAGRNDEASALVRHVLLIALGGGLLFTLTLAVFPLAIFTFIAGPDIAAAAAPYALWLFGAGAIPAWLANTLGSVLRGGQRHRLAARILILTWVVFPVLGWALAEPGGLGLMGLGIAYAVSFAAAALIMSIVVLRGGAGFTPSLRGPISASLLNRVLSVGLVACGLAAISNLTTILVTSQIKHYGTTAVAAYGISARLEFFVVPLAFGIGSALTALVGGAVGARDWLNARRIAWLGGALAFAVTATIGLLVAVFSRPFALFFTQDPGVVDVASLALMFIGPAFGAYGLGMAMYFAAMGAGRMRWPVYGAFARIIVATLGGWVLATVFDMGISGHFLGVALGIVCYGLFTARGVRAAYWRASDS